MNNLTFRSLQLMIDYDKYNDYIYHLKTKLNYT